MKFIACSKPAHKEYGDNAPVNLEHCYTYTVGAIHAGKVLPEAPILAFGVTGGAGVVTWTFENEADRDSEIARIDSIVILRIDPDLEREAATLARLNRMTA